MLDFIEKEKLRIEEYLKASWVWSPCCNRSINAKRTPKGVRFFVLRFISTNRVGAKNHSFILNS